jgi:soluble lytic murein transglycosylase-like protein
MRQLSSGGLTLKTSQPLCASTFGRICIGIAVGVVAFSSLSANAATLASRQLMEQGKRFEYGVGAPQDIDRALALYCKASGLGLAEAHYHLGWLYASGRVGKVDQVLAAAWFKAALAADHGRAAEQLRELGALDLDLQQQPQCVLSAAMLERRIPRARGGTPVAPAANPEPSAFAIREVGRADIVSLIRRLAPDYRLDPELVLAVVQVESNFNPTARSPKRAQGLMQLIPETAERFGVTDVWDPVDNLRGGMAYLRWLLDHFNGDLELALAGYNAGENAVAQYGGVPPYSETQRYVRRIRALLGAGS